LNNFFETSFFKPLMTFTLLKELRDVQYLHEACSAGSLGEFFGGLSWCRMSGEGEAHSAP